MHFHISTWIALCCCCLLVSLVVINQIFWFHFLCIYKPMTFLCWFIIFICWLVGYFLYHIKIIAKGYESKYYSWLPNDYFLRSIFQYFFQGSFHPVCHCWWSWPFNHSRSTESAWFMWVWHNWARCSILWSFGRWSCYPGLVLSSFSSDIYSTTWFSNCVSFSSGCCYKIFSKGDQFECDYWYVEGGKFVQLLVVY